MSNSNTTNCTTNCMGWCLLDFEHGRTCDQLRVSVHVAPSPDLRDLGFKGYDAFYVGVARRKDGSPMKRIGRYPGYSDVQVVRTGELRTVRSDLIEVAR